MQLNSKLVAIMCYALGPMMFGVLPVAVNAFIGHLGFGTEQAGYLASIDIAGLFFGQLLTASIIRQLPARQIAILGCLLFIGGNFLTAFSSSFGALAVIRFFSELGGGIFMALCMTYLSRTDNPDRYMGFGVGLQLVLTISLLLLSPMLLAKFGLKGFFLTMTVISLLSVLAVFVPLEMNFDDQSSISLWPSKLENQDKNAFFAVCNVLIYWIGIGAFWAFAEVIAAEHNFDPQQISNSMAISQVIGFLGAIFTSWMSTRYGRLRPTLFGLAVQMLSMLALLQTDSFTIYAVALSAWSFAWSVVLIYQLAMISDFDKKGIFTSLGTSAQAMGVAVGPALVALVLSDKVLLPVVVISLTSIFLTALASMYVSYRREKSILADLITPSSIS